MAECYRCGVSDEKERLFNAISRKGVVKICKNCSNEEDLPIIQPADLNKPKRVKSVYERLSAMAKLDPEKHRKMLVYHQRRKISKDNFSKTLKDIRTLTQYNEFVSLNKSNI